MKTAIYTAILLLTAGLWGVPTAQGQSIPQLKDPVVNFGLQAGPIFPSSLFRVRANEGVSEEGIVYSINTNTGFQLGGLATFRLSSRFQVQGGIMLLLRNYDCSAVLNESRHELRLRTTVYDIPILLTYYQRLTDRVLLSLGTGLSLQSTPTNLNVFTPEFEVFAARRSFFVPASLTMAGVEFRQAKQGFFVGISYSVTPFPLYDTDFRARFSGPDNFFRLPHIGDYFGLVLRYYLD